MPRPICAVIHQENLKHNLNIAKSNAASASVYAVIKANAYGHGIENVFPSFKNVDGFALLDLDEAILIRSLGWEGEILLLEGIFHSSDLKLCHTYKLNLVVHNEQQIQWIQEDTTIDAGYNIFLKMNSGMNRLGFKTREYKNNWHRLKSLYNVKSITHMTHFSDADLSSNNQNLGIVHQVQYFEKCIENLPGKRSVSNSAAILGHPYVNNDILRSGIMLYGSSPNYPFNDICDWNLKPTMSLRSEVISIQHLEKGDSIGYGSTYITSKKMTIAVVACGYADGYQRTTKSGTAVLVNGKRASLVGRVSMDMLTVDITHLPQTNLGDEVVLWGYASTGEILSVDEVATGSDTLGYELMCGITKRVRIVTQ